ncbi:MerR family transcriptional regulator [Aeromicrobium panaciterrae]|uniref:MerR family transcriptional regulator n=1 Tax=Aeromicrobium panaciterrae TaxID=363861 RepID=UPI0031D87463
MLTIGELASYAGVTVRAVRHYHQVGLLPEPERDHSGYRRYGSLAVVELTKIRTLAEAGVPLSRIAELLGADEETFREAVKEIDKTLRAEIQRLQANRKQIAQLAAGDSLVVPPEVVAYLDRLRELGVSERMIDGERDGWILVAARWPDRIAEWMPEKFAELENPVIVRLYRVLGDAIEASLDDPILEEAADIMVELAEQAAARGDLDNQDEAFDDQPFIDLLDGLVVESAPQGERLLELMRERGWTGWTKLERTDS